MKDKELLLAISNIVQSQIDPLKQDVSELKQDVSVLKQDVSGLKQDVSVLKQDISDVKADIRHLQREVANTKEEVVVIKLVIENDIRPRLQNIEDCYLTTFHRYQSKAAQIDTIQTDIDAIKGVVSEHGEAIQKLQLA